DAADVDFYRFQAAQGDGTTVMTVTTRALLVNGVTPKVEVYENNQTPVTSAQILVNGNGTYIVQVPNARSGANYFVRALAAPYATTITGNYTLTIEFGRTGAEVETFASERTLDQGSPEDNHALYVAQSQLFQFVLTETLGTSTNSAVRMTILGEDGNEVFSMRARSGETVSTDRIFLVPGAYRVRFTMEGMDEGSPEPLQYTIRGRNLSDPIGPVIDDPTMRPLYGTEDPTIFRYPGDIISRNPFLWVVLGMF